MPLTNDQKEFDEQVLALVKILIDSLNEEQLSLGIIIDKREPRGLDKLEAFLFSDLRVIEWVNFGIESV